MKFIISLFLIVFVVISVINESFCESGNEKRRLSRILENLNNKKPEGDQQDDLTKPIDIDCAKSFFKFPQTQKMVLNEFEEMIFVIGARLKCSDQIQPLQFNITHFERDGIEQYPNCLKFYLQKLEPTSKLIENFEISEDEILKCKRRIYIEEIEELQNIFESVVGPLSEFTCGAVTDANDYVKFIAKNAIVNSGDISKNLKEIESRNLRKYFRKIVFSTINCVIKRFEDNPSANDTLAYYLNKGFDPITRGIGNNEKYGLHKLANVEVNTENDCVKEKLDFAKFGNTTVIDVEAAILIASAKSKCNTVDFKSLLKTFLASVIESEHSSYYNIICSKLSLQKLEPTSRLANYSTNDDDYFEEFCESFNLKIYFYRLIISVYEKAVGKLTETTCGLFTNELFNVISYKTILLAAEKDEELKTSEMEKFVEEMIEMLHRLSDCFYEYIESLERSEA